MTERPYKNLAGSETIGLDVMNHDHVFNTMADVAHHHQHLIIGTTSPAIPRNKTHVHRICVRTSFDPKGNDPHWHQVDIMTGPAFDTPNGEHTHYYCGSTSFDLDHCHSFSSVTDTSPEEEAQEEPEHEYSGCKYRR